MLFDMRFVVLRWKMSVGWVTRMTIYTSKVDRLSPSGGLAQWQRVSFRSTDYNHTEGLGVRHPQPIKHSIRILTNKSQFESLVRRLFAILRPPACSHGRRASFGIKIVLIGQLFVMKIELRLKLHWVRHFGRQKIVLYTLQDALWCAKKDEKRWIP
jgi:hypothetical protein